MSRFWSSIKDSKMANDVQQESLVLAETFERHWEQLKGITNNNSVPTSDDVVAVINLLNQMTALLAMELSALSDESDLPSLNDQYDSLLSSEPSSLGINPCLDILLSENILSHVLAASRMPITPDQQDQLRLEQLKLYEVLLDQSSARARSLLSHQPFLKPLLEVLNECCTSEYKMCNESQDHLVMLLNQLCSRLRDNIELVEIFFRSSDNNLKGKEKFVIFTILLRFLHSDGHVGSRARDALLLCISLSKSHDGIGDYIANGTDFCHHLAYGLSGIYSSMPRKLENPRFSDPAWYRLSQFDIAHLPDLKRFLSILEFCDAVVTVAHDSVKEHLLSLIYMGFLEGVLKPALTQSLESELVCSTAYLELFIRKITEPRLLAVFLQFLFTETHDGKVIIDILVTRLALQSQLSTVTLSLFETLIGLNVEDVMLWLIFQHLTSLKAFLPKHKDLLRVPDVHGRAAEKLLALSPICTAVTKPLFRNGIADESTPNKSSGTSSLPTFLVGFGKQPQEGLAMDAAHEAIPDPSGYQGYLVDARKAVRDRYEASQCWRYPYDGILPPSPDASASIAADSGTCDNTYYSNGSGTSMTSEEKRDFWNIVFSNGDQISLPMSQDSEIQVQVGPTTVSKSASNDNLETSNEAEEFDYSISSLGPFLDLLLEKVELMPTNNLSTNLLVTSILSQLSSFPQPLLRGVLVHPDVILQPSVRGLYTAISSLRQKLDNIMPTYPGSDDAILACKKYLMDRLDVQPKRRDSNVSMISTITQFGNEAGRATRSSISSVFSSVFKSSKKPNSPVNSTMSSNAAASVKSEAPDPLANLNSEVRGYAMAAVILEEWLQELAAIAQEQSVMMKEEMTFKGLEVNEKSNNNSSSSAILETPPVMIRANDMETSMS